MMRRTYSSFSSNEAREELDDKDSVLKVKYDQRYSSYYTGGQWNDEEFTSDTSLKVFCGRKLHKSGLKLQTDANSQSVSATSQNVHVTGSSKDSSLSVCSGTRKRPLVSPNVTPKRLKLDFSLEDGGEVDVLDMSLRNMKKVPGRPGVRARWFCLLCLTDLTGQNLELHFRSSEHVKRAVTSATSDIVDSPFYCQLCRAACNSEKLYNDHVIGKKHQKLKTALERINALPSSTVDVVSELKAELAETVVEEGKASDLGISDDIKEFSTMDGPLIGLQYAVEIGELKGKKPVYHCSLCNVHVVSGNKANHFCSNSHRQLALQKDYPDRWLKIKSSSKEKTEINKLVLQAVTEIEKVEGRMVGEVWRKITQKEKVQISENKGKTKAMTHPGKGSSDSRRKGGTGKGKGKEAERKRTGKGRGLEQGMASKKQGKGGWLQATHGGRRVRESGGREASVGQGRWRREKADRGAGPQSMKKDEVRGGRGAWEVRRYCSFSLYGKERVRDKGKGLETWRDKGDGRSWQAYEEEWLGDRYDQDDQGDWYGSYEGQYASSDKEHLSCSQGYYEEWEPHTHSMHNPQYLSSYTSHDSYEPLHPSSYSSRAHHHFPHMSWQPMRHEPPHLSAGALDPLIHRLPPHAAASSAQNSFQSLLKVVNNQSQPSDIDNLASSLVRTAEDAGVALKLSSVLNQALVRYQARNALPAAMSFPPW